MILILGAEGDEDASAVHEELEKRGVDSAFFDPDRLSGIGAVALSLAGAGRLEGVLRPGGGEVHIEDIHAVWLGRQRHSFSAALLDDLWEVLDAPVLPGAPSDVECASHELRQLHAASDAGFVVRATTVAGSSDKRVALTHEDVASQCRLRITVVGTKVFTAAIHSETFETWRYEDNPSAIAYALPATYAQRCYELVQRLELEYATIDATLSATNELVFIGLDPHGEYCTIETVTGLPIARTIAELLRERTISHAFDENLDGAESSSPAPRRRHRGRFLANASRRLHPSYTGPRKAQI